MTKSNGKGNQSGLNEGRPGRGALALFVLFAATALTALTIEGCAVGTSQPETVEELRLKVHQKALGVQKVLGE